MKKTSSTPRDIDEYIAGHPPAVQKLLQQIRQIVRAAAPGAEEAIKYQMPTFVLHGNLIHFGAYKKHIGVYPVPRNLPRFRERVAEYGGEKSTLQLPLDAPLPADLLREIVEYRVQQDAERA